MSLYTSLRLALSTFSKVRAKTPQPIEEAFDLLLTQAEDFIITQDERLLAYTRAVVLTDLYTQDDLEIITQDGRIIKAIS